MVTALEDEQLASQTNAVQTADEQNLTASKIGFVVRKIDAEYYRSRTKKYETINSNPNLHFEPRELKIGSQITILEFEFGFDSDAFCVERRRLVRNSAELEWLLNYLLRCHSAVPCADKSHIASIPLANLLTVLERCRQIIRQESAETLCEFQNAVVDETAFQLTHFFHSAICSIFCYEQYVSDPCVREFFENNCKLPIALPNPLNVKRVVSKISSATSQLIRNVSQVTLSTIAGSPSQRGEAGSFEKSHACAKRVLANLPNVFECVNSSLVDPVRIVEILSNQRDQNLNEALRTLLKDFTKGQTDLVYPFYGLLFSNFSRHCAANALTAHALAHSSSLDSNSQSTENLRAARKASLADSKTQVDVIMDKVIENQENYIGSLQKTIDALTQFEVAI